MSRSALRGLRAAATLLTAAMGVIHLWLWFDSYREVALLGPLFLVNGIVSVLLAVALVVAPIGRLVVVAALSAVFTAGTLAALVMSLTVGFFGTRESLQSELVPTTLVVEALGTLACLALALVARRGAGSTRVART